MAVALDAVSTAVSNSGTGQTSTDHKPSGIDGMTVGAALSNGALLFIAFFDTKTVSGVALTWDNAGTPQAMTNLGSKAVTGTSGIAFLFGLRNPHSGNKTLHAAWTTAAECSLFGISYSGVDPTNDATAFQHFTSDAQTTNSASVTVTSATGNAVVAAMICPTAGLSSLNNTTLFNNGGATNTNNGANRAAGAASIAMTASLAASDTWAAVGIDVVAAGAVDTLFAQACM